MNANLPNKGEVWKIDHERKGKMTVRILKIDDSWMDAEIVAGRAKMLSHANEDALPGESLRMRLSLLRFVEKIAATPSTRSTK